jgi:hypothetical protein
MSILLILHLVSLLIISHLIHFNLLSHCSLLLHLLWIHYTIIWSYLSLLLHLLLIHHGVIWGFLSFISSHKFFLSLLHLWRKLMVLLIIEILLILLLHLGFRRGITLRLLHFLKIRIANLSLFVWHVHSSSKLVLFNAVDIFGT